MTDIGPVTGLLVTPTCRELRLSPLAAVVLEDLLLDGREGLDGEVVAATSARAVGEHLGVGPKEVARALAQLRRRELVRLLPSSGRFDLAAYRVIPGPGRRLVLVTDDRAGVVAPLRRSPARRAGMSTSAQPQLDLGEARP